jgi:hypothetical protein
MAAIGHWEFLPKMPILSRRPFRFPAHDALKLRPQTRQDFFAFPGAASATAASAVRYRNVNVSCK